MENNQLENGPAETNLRGELFHYAVHLSRALYSTTFECGQGKTLQNAITLSASRVLNLSQAWYFYKQREQCF